MQDATLSLKSQAGSNARTLALSQPLLLSKTQPETPPAAVTSAPASGDSQGKQPTTQLDRGQILDATWQCLREHGYDATTIRKIAGTLSCAIGSIYRYYRDKHDLLCCVTQRPFEAVADAIEAGESFATTAGMYSSLAKRETQSYSLMFWLANQRIDEQAPDAASNQLPPVVTRIIQGWTAQTGSHEQTMQRWAMLHGAITAGVDGLAMLDAAGLLTSPASLVHEPAPSDLHDRTAQQIVTVMRTPPLPRHLRQALVRSEVQHDAMDTNHDSSDNAHAHSVRQKEDVCLL